jgi:hypothetical protein
VRYRYNDWGQPEVFDDGLGAYRAMSSAEAAQHRIHQLAQVGGLTAPVINMGQTPSKFTDHRAPLTVRFKIVKACSKALEAAKVNDRSNREPILTGVYVDDRTYIKLLRELRGNANGVTMMPTDAEALEKGEWMGAPMYIVRRPCASYAEHIVATAEVLPTRRIG